MKKTVMFLVVISFVMSASAHISVAGNDDFWSAKRNAAAMGVGNSSGFTFVGNYDEDHYYQDWYSLYFNFDNLAYVLERDVCQDSHTIAISTPMNGISKNLYLGSKYYWKNKYFKDGNFSASILYRPVNCISLGAIANNIDTDDIAYEFGAALRPFRFLPNFWNRVTLSADYNYIDDDLSDPVIGLQTEILDGLKLGANYDLTKEVFGLNFGINFSNLGIGTHLAMDENDEFKEGQQYITISDKTFRSFLKKPKRECFIDYKLKGDILEKNQEQKIGPFTIVFDKGKTLSQIIDDIEKMKKNDKVKGIIFKSGNFYSNFAQRKELADAILDFKSTGKKVAFYYETIGGANYAFAASIADMIYLNPIGMIDLKGVSVSMPYVKNLLDTLGIDVVNLRSHPYKTAGNIFSEEEMTQAERATYQTLLDDFYDEITKMIVSGRGNKLTRPIDEIVDEGPFWDAERALELGLIDEIIYEDQLEDKLKDAFEIKNVTKNFKQNKICYDWHKPGKDKIALIYAIGNIHSGKGIPGGSIGSETIVKAIKNAREDRSVKGIIIRVDSGGGSAIASDIIAREIELCKTGKNPKPIVISMGGAAASGGYYIATLADKIIAQPTTITGSIGVIGIFPVMERLFDKIHVNWSTVKKGKHADLGAIHRQMTADEKNIMEKSIEHFYDRFITLVAKGRNMEKDEVHEIAQGKVWTGKRALDNGLIDALGGMELAAQEVKKMADIKREIEFKEFDGQEEKMKLSINIEALASIPAPLRAMLEISKQLEMFEKENILMIQPTIPDYK